MKTRMLFAMAALFFVARCSKTPEVNSTPAFVPVEKVRSIVIARNASEQTLCEKEVRASGARILYQNSLGALMTDREPGDLKLSRCQALVSPNAPLNVGQRDGEPGNSPDLPTLLKLVPAEEIGARSFIDTHPTYDGRGVVVAILDTGIELDHPMLRTTTDGAVKILDFQDFSGEGNVDVAPVTVTNGQFQSPGGATYSVAGIMGSGFAFGVFKGATLAATDKLSTLDTFIDIGVLLYQVEGAWRARLDTDGDLSFANESELYDFAVSRLFTKIGAKKSLTVSANIAPSGKGVSLCFDDGSHGTHVAGIATGYEPNGLRGVAPGAQVVLGKIGDNRLSGGSTTTASMMLAIDFAVQKKARVVNLSYGIRAGSNAGKSTIDQYIDKVAREKGVLFSISAGNEGPGLLTVGVPAGANLAITNAAYVSKVTAQENYGYVGVQDDNTWYFSSVGPRLDGGWKPTLLAPGSAVSSVPLWLNSHENFRGTSMASPEVTGGLALLLSGALQQALPTDRATITNVVYQGARPLSSLAWIEQGHGLMNVPLSFNKLLGKAGAAPATEYNLVVNSPTVPGGVGAGIYVRSRQLPTNLFTVSVTPIGPLTPDVKTFHLNASDDWIHPAPTFWLQSGPRTFQVDLDPVVLKEPGLHSGKISVIEDSTGEVAFEVPVTVVSPSLLDDASQHHFAANPSIKVGQTLRYFLDVPAGATAIQLNLTTDGPVVWGQLLNAEGRLVATLRDPEATMPQPPLVGQANIVQPGVYELDLVAPPNNKRPARIQVDARIFSLSTVIGPHQNETAFDLVVQNNFEAVKVVPKLEWRSLKRKQVVPMGSGPTRIPLVLSPSDLSSYDSVKLVVSTAKKYYDLMTDYPYWVNNAQGVGVTSGGLELETPVELALANVTPGTLSFGFQGAFTSSAPAQWAVDFSEERILKAPVPITTFPRVLLEPGQSTTLTMDLSGLQPVGTLSPCATLSLTAAGGSMIQEIPLCK